VLIQDYLSWRWNDKSGRENGTEARVIYTPCHTTRNGCTLGESRLVRANLEYMKVMLIVVAKDKNFFGLRHLL
jgi:hypothetical protein